MTKKDFELIARVLKEVGSRPFALSDRESELHSCICVEFADELQHVNPRFNRVRFLAACRPE